MFQKVILITLLETHGSYLLGQYSATDMGVPKRMYLNFYFYLLATKTQQDPREVETDRHLCGQGQS